MTTTKILASSVMALAALAAGGAFADSSYPSSVVTPAQSTVSRAEVRADLAQAEKSGHWLTMNDHKNDPMAVQAGPANSRADVRAALSEARRNGSLANFHS